MAKWVFIAGYNRANPPPKPIFIAVISPNSKFEINPQYGDWLHSSPPVRG
jgi:hypothetical protein